jgi:hypothetical protein
MQLQGDRTIQNGQIADASVSALFNPATAPLTVRADEISAYAKLILYCPPKFLITPST